MPNLHFNAIIILNYYDNIYFIFVSILLDVIVGRGDKCFNLFISTISTRGIHILVPISVV